MQATGTKLTSAVEAYLGDLRRIRASGGATGERSTYGPLSNLLNGVGGALRPRVFCVGELAQQGAGHPDFGLYAAKQVQKGKPKEGQLPECGVVEVKPAGDDAWLTAESEQVSTYWNKYRLVLVTNTRDFVLLGEDAAGKPVKLEAFRLAESEAAFEARLQHPRAFAHEVGAGLGEYLCRALSHRATLVEPKDVAWLLASYARDGLARVEAAGDAPSLAVVRSALEEALGVRFEGERGRGRYGVLDIVSGDGASVVEGYAVPTAFDSTRCLDSLRITTTGVPTAHRRGYSRLSTTPMGTTPRRRAYPETRRMTLSQRIVSPSQNNSWASFSSRWYGALRSALNKSVNSAQTSRNLI